MSQLGTAVGIFYRQQQALWLIEHGLKSDDPDTLRETLLKVRFVLDGHDLLPSESLAHAREREANRPKPAPYPKVVELRPGTVPEMRRSHGGNHVRVEDPDR